MTSDQFVYWLQGLFELGNPTILDKEQVTMIKEHIAIVLKKVTPDSESEKIKKLKKLAEEIKNNKYTPGTFENRPPQWIPTKPHDWNPHKVTCNTETVQQPATYC